VQLRVQVRVDGHTAAGMQLAGDKHGCRDGVAAGAQAQGQSTLLRQSRWQAGAQLRAWAEPRTRGHGGGVSRDHRGGNRWNGLLPHHGVHGGGHRGGGSQLRLLRLLLLRLLLILL
jgi:hypothetical protein